MRVWCVSRESSTASFDVRREAIAVLREVGVVHDLSVCTWEPTHTPLAFVTATPDPRRIQHTPLAFVNLGAKTTGKAPARRPTPTPIRVTFARVVCLRGRFRRSTLQTRRYSPPLDYKREGGLSETELQTRVYPFHCVLLVAVSPVTNARVVSDGLTCAILLVDRRIQNRD